MCTILSQCSLLTDQLYDKNGGREAKEQIGPKGVVYIINVSITIEFQNEKPTMYKFFLATTKLFAFLLALNLMSQPSTYHSLYSQFDCLSCLFYVPFKMLLFIPLPIFWPTISLLSNLSSFFSHLRFFSFALLHNSHIPHPPPLFYRTLILHPSFKVSHSHFLSNPTSSS